MSRAAVLTLRPRIGRPWQGGVSAGLEDNHHVISGPHHNGTVGWAGAMAWATSLEVNGFADFTLPTCAELLLLDGAFPRLIRREVYWSREACGGSPGDAMAVHFHFGAVAHWGKHHPAYAVAVRRVPT